MLISKYKRISAIYVALSVLYIGFTLLAEPSKATLAQYSITANQLRLVSLAVILPYIVIWFIALLGYVRLKDYTAFIKSSKDGKAFSTVVLGILWLGLWMPISSVAASAAAYYYNVHPDSTAALVWTLNYLNIVLLLAAFYTIYIGTEKLVALIKRPRTPVTGNALLGPMVFIAFSALYVLLVLSDPTREFASQSVPVATYYQPDWLIVTTIIIPRLITWYLGIQAARNMYVYSRKMQGSLYRHALKYVALGVGGVVVATILLRVTQSLNGFLSQLGLGLILVVVYVLLACISVGYIMIAKGARRLQRLEEL